MPIHDNITFHKVTMAYGSVNDLAPNYMKYMFTDMQDLYSHMKRSSVKNDLNLPTVKNKELYIQSFAYSGAKIWNPNKEGEASLKKEDMEHYQSCHSQSAKSKEF